MDDLGKSSLHVDSAKGRLRSEFHMQTEVENEGNYVANSKRKKHSFGGSSMWIYQMRVFLKKHNYPNNGLSAPFPFEWVTGSLGRELCVPGSAGRPAHCQVPGTQVASPRPSCSWSELAQWRIAGAD